MTMGQIQNIQTT